MAPVRPLLPRSRLSSRRAVLKAAGALAGWCALPGAGVRAAPGYPTQAVRLVVPFPVGGNTDIVARLLSKALAEDLGQPVVIENKAGAGGNIGVDAVAKAAPDGHTLAYSTLSTWALNVGLYSKLPFDPLKDLAPVALTVEVPLALVVPATSGIRTLAELIQQCKAQPGRYNYASAGNGTSSHIACHLFARMAGIDVQHVPYKGTAPAMTDLVAGTVSFGMDAPSVLNPLIKAGRLTALAVAVPRRMKSMPAVPTFDEAGLKGFRAYSWNGVWAPAGTPATVLDRLNAAFNKAMADPANVRQIEEADVIPYAAMNRSQVERFMRTEYETWVPLVRGMGVRLD